MPRSPSEGAATRGPADLEVQPDTPLRDRRATARNDRRTEDLGPPGGIERRRYERRSHDRRAQPRTDRRARNRRSSIGRRGTNVAARPLPRVAPRDYLAPPPTRSRTAKFLRALLITAVAVACLLAATLTGPSKAGAAAKVVGSVHVTSGETAATITWVRAGTSNYREFRNLRLTIKSDGRTTLSKAKLGGLASSSYLTKPQLQLVDVTGDDVPDAVVDLYSGGAHCCSISAIARSSTTGWTKPLVRDWRDDGYKLADLGGTPLPEFQSTDIRFNDRYVAHAASRSPIQIWSMDGGTLKDVTKQFPEYIKADVTEQAQGWADAAQAGDADAVRQIGRAAAAAWIADLALLGQYDDAKAVVAAMTARGDLKGDEAFTGVLGHDLVTLGYVTDATLLGLTDTPLK